MRKQTKIAVGLSAAALLVIGASMTSFATRGWANEDGQWYYYDNAGDYVTDSWKSYNGTYFYLGDEGYMLTNELIEDGDNYYYVDANGAMVKNVWVAIPADDDEEQDVDYRWYYFGSTGKAYKDSNGKTIAGKKYGFDENGKMLFGFVDDKDILNDEDDPILHAIYYYGTNDDGARYTGWLKYTDGFVDSSYTKDFYWFYFGTDGKKVADKTKTISSKKYSFDANGAMEFEWNYATLAGTNTEAYWSTNDDGSLKKNAWIWCVPSEDQNADDNADDTDRWFRVNNAGATVKDQTKKINSKWYVFDASGIMQYGLVYLTGTEVNGSAIDTVIDDDSSVKKGVADEDVISADDIYTIYETLGGNLYYFSNDEEKDGSMKTGNSVKIEIADDTYTFGFTKTKGVAMNGVSSNKVYRAGILQEAGDQKYKVVTVQINGNDCDFLVGTNGTRVKKAHYAKDADDYYWAVHNTGSDTTGYVVERCDTLAEAKAAIKETT